MKRYSYHDEPLTPEEAGGIRAQHLEGILCEIDYLSREIAELNKRFSEIKGSPLPETRRVQTTLNPGDPGYDQAPPNFDLTDYQGDVMWLNTPNEKQA